MHILIAVEHAAVRRGLRETLADAFPDAFSEACNVDGVVKYLAEQEYALHLLDIECLKEAGLKCCGT